MILHCQFTIGSDQNDATPTVVMGVVRPDDPLQGAMIDIIKALVASSLGAQDAQDAAPSRHLGFAPHFLANDPEHLQEGAIT